MSSHDMSALANRYGLNGLKRISMPYAALNTARSVSLRTSYTIMSRPLCHVR